MSLQRLGFTRSAQRSNHLLSTPETFVRTTFPGLTDAVAIVHVSPAIGAEFAQYTVEMNPGGVMEECPAQRFVYVLEGNVRADGRRLTDGGFASFSEGTPHRITAASAARLAVIEKPYCAGRGGAHPDTVFGREQDVVAQHLGDDPWLEVRSLLPSGSEHDFAVNTMTYQPGASLPAVEIHVMEHGLLMLEGGGIYRLGDSWYPVTAGDFIWMGPYCPQWFGAIGKTPAKYLIYKDFNRAPL